MTNPVRYSVLRDNAVLVPSTPFPAYLRRDFSAPEAQHENMLDCQVAELERHVYDRGGWDGQASAIIALRFDSGVERLFEITADFSEPLISIEELK